MITKNMVAVRCEGHRSAKLKNTLAKAAMFYLDELKVTDASNPLEISIILTSLDTDGYCDFNYDHKYPEITVYLNKSTKDVQELLLFLAHECVHAKQFLKKELILNGLRGLWKNQEYPSIDFIDSPWEQEAYREEQILFKRLINERI